MLDTVAVYAISPTEVLSPAEVLSPSDPAGGSFFVRVRVWWVIVQAQPLVSPDIISIQLVGKVSVMVIFFGVRA